MIILHDVIDIRTSRFYLVAVIHPNMAKYFVASTGNESEFV